MTAGRISGMFLTLAALASGVALGALLADRLTWCAGAGAAAAIALIGWGLAAAIAKPDVPEPGQVMWRTTAPFGVERVITPAPVTTELVYKPLGATAVIPGGQRPHWADDEHRPVWPTDIFGAPE